MSHTQQNFKHRMLFLLTGILVCTFFMNSARGPVRAGEGGRTGAPFDGSTCGAAGCHHGGIFHSTLSVTLQTPGGTVVNSYIPGVSYNLHISFAGAVASLVKYGFQTVCVDSATYGNINTWGTVPANTHDTVWNGRNYVEQTATLVSGNIVIPWTAPASGTGTVKFFVGGCVANGNLLPTGDTTLNDSVTIAEDLVGCVPASLSVAITGVTCYGDSTGGVNLTTTGGSGVTAYAWTGPFGFTSATENITGIVAGTYTVVVFSAGGCSDTTTATVTQPGSPLTVSPTSNGPVCAGNTITFWSATSGGTPLYNYSWTGPGGFTSLTDTNRISGLAAADTGVYTVTIVDDYGCSVSGMVDISLAPVPIDSLSDTVLCIGTSITLNAGNTGDTFLWSTAATTQTISVSDTGYYSVAITNSFGCVSNDTIHVGLNCPSLISNLLLQDIQLYPNPARELVNIQANEDRPVGHLQLFSMDGVLIFDRNNISEGHILLNTDHFAPGIYTLKISNTMGTSMILLDIAP